MIINSLVNGQIRMNDDIDKHWNVTYHLLVKKKSSSELEEILRIQVK